MQSYERKIMELLEVENEKIEQLGLRWEPGYRSLWITLILEYKL